MRRQLLPILSQVAVQIQAGYHQMVSHLRDSTVHNFKLNQKISTTLEQSCLSGFAPELNPS